MKNLYILIVLLSLAFAPLAFGQDKSQETENGKIKVTQRDYENKEVAMADQFREEGKIYVVVAVLTTIFVGIVAFLVVTESKLKKLEDLVEAEQDFKAKKIS